MDRRRPLGAHRDSKPAHVTQWGSLKVADFARAAGFSGGSLHDAVALAIAASGGADHYRHNPISAPGAERRGLWAIRVDEVPAEMVADLFDPAVNAGVARALYGLSGATFGWHPTWINGTAAHVRPAVVAHVTSRGKRNGPLSGREFHAHMTGLTALAEAYAQALEVGIVPNA